MTHAAVAVGAGVLVRFPRRPLAFWLPSVALATWPDLDVITWVFHIPHGSMWAHRGAAHSLAAAFVAAALFTALARRGVGGRRWSLRLYSLVVAGSHGVLDAFTSGGRGVAFFAPFSQLRYLFPFRPIPAAPLGLAYFSQRGLYAFEAELLWVWGPTVLVVGAAALLSALAGRARKNIGRGRSRGGSLGEADGETGDPAVPSQR